MQTAIQETKSLKALKALRRIACLCAVLLLSFAIEASAQEPKELDSPALMVITHISSAIDSISSDELKRIYLGKKRHWKNRTRILPADHKKGGRSRAIWLSEALDISDKEYKRKWLRNTFSGKAIPPISFSSSEDLIDYVAKTEGAIGYIQYTADSLPETIRVIKVDGLAGIYSKK